MIVLIYLEEHGDQQRNDKRLIKYKYISTINELMQPDLNADGENQTENCEQHVFPQKACICLAICSSNIFEVVGSVEIGR